MDEDFENSSVAVSRISENQAEAITRLNQELHNLNEQAGNMYLPPETLGEVLTSLNRTYDMAQEAVWVGQQTLNRWTDKPELDSNFEEFKSLVREMTTIASELQQTSEILERTRLNYTSIGSLKKILARATSNVEKIKEDKKRKQNRVQLEDFIVQLKGMQNNMNIKADDFATFLKVQTSIALNVEGHGEQRALTGDADSVILSTIAATATDKFIQSSSMARERVMQVGSQVGSAIGTVTHAIIDVAQKTVASFATRNPQMQPQATPTPQDISVRNIVDIMSNSNIDAAQNPMGLMGSGSFIVAALENAMPSEGSNTDALDDANATTSTFTTPLIMQEEQQQEGSRGQSMALASMDQDQGASMAAASMGPGPIHFQEQRRVPQPGLLVQPASWLTSMVHPSGLIGQFVSSIKDSTSTIFSRGTNISRSSAAAAASASAAVPDQGVDPASIDLITQAAIMAKAPNDVISLNLDQAIGTIRSIANSPPRELIANSPPSDLEEGEIREEEGQGYVSDIEHEVDINGGRKRKSRHHKKSKATKKRKGRKQKGGRKTKKGKRHYKTLKRHRKRSHK